MWDHMTPDQTVADRATSHHTTRGALALLATVLVSLVVAAPAARAEPTAASSTTDACLAKPNAPSPQGSHWFYHLDRTSGRHCWYLRAQDANAGDAKIAGPRSASAPTVRPSAPANLLPADAPAETLADGGGDRNAIKPVVAPPSPPSMVWPSAPAASTEPAPAQMDAAPNVIVPPVKEPQVEARKPDLDALPPKRNPARPPAVERPSDSVVEPAHMPALLGTALALAIIIVGSLAARLILRLMRRPRRRSVLDITEPGWDTPLPQLVASPGIAAAMPWQGDITRATRDPRAQAFPPRGGWNAVAKPAAQDDRRSDDRRSDDRRQGEPGEEVRRYAPRRARAQDSRRDRTPDQRGAPAVPPSRDAARVLEDNVRELLHRLRKDLRTQTDSAGVRAAADRAPAMRAGDLRRARPTS
jgi:hypothetical protein